MPSPYQLIRRSDRIQLDDIDDYRWCPHLMQFTLGAAAASIDLSATMNTAVGTAGRNAQPVRNRIPDAADPEGWMVGVAAGRITIDVSTSRQPPSDAGDEVFGRIAEAAGVYTLSFWKNDGGTGADVAVTLPAGDFDAWICYRHSIESWPEDAVARVLKHRVSQDPPVASQPLVEHLTIAATNTIPALSAAPRAGTYVKLVKNNRPFYSNHPTPVFTFVGPALTWDAAAASMDLYPGDRVTAEYVV